MLINQIYLKRIHSNKGDDMARAKNSRGELAEEVKRDIDKIIEDILRHLFKE
jgi:hypothetical protein